MFFTLLLLTSLYAQVLSSAEWCSMLRDLISPSTPQDVQNAQACHRRRMLAEARQKQENAYHTSTSASPEESTAASAPAATSTTEAQPGRCDQQEPAPDVAPSASGWRAIGKQSAGEEETRLSLESLLNVPFGKARPHWLVNPISKRRLELDCYNESLKLAVEYNGSQHAVFPNSYHWTRQQFEQQLHRDALKKSLCALAGVTLIVVLTRSVVLKFEPI